MFHHFHRGKEGIWNKISESCVDSVDFISMGLAKIFSKSCVKAQSAMFTTKSYASVANKHKSANLASTTET